MKTPALILLLLIMLVPRLAGAALPHALICASTAATVNIAAEQSHHDHEMPTHPHSEMHAEHNGHVMPTLDADAADKTPHQISPNPIDLNPINLNQSSDNGCQHCGSCDDHCSVLLLTSQAKVTDITSHTVLIAAIGAAPSGFSLDLNRPPRTRSL